MSRYISYILIFTMLLCAEAEAKKKKYYASICAIFQNEAPYLKEWIKYHRLLGFEHFYLYNNESTDNFQKVLLPYIAKGIVELKEWSLDYSQNFDQVQKGAYNHCIGKCKEETYWLAVIDVDEFIFPVKEVGIKKFLEPYDKLKKLGGVMMHWMFYGTSGLSEIPKGKLLIESLTHRAPFEYGRNRNCKTICKPDRVSYYHVHGAQYRPGYYDIHTNGRGGPMTTLLVDKIRVNHYWTRAEDFLFQVKVPRREKFEGKTWDIKYLKNELKILNQIEDKCMERYVPSLRGRLKKSST